MSMTPKVLMLIFDAAALSDVGVTEALGSLEDKVLST